MKHFYYVSFIRWPAEKAHSSYVTSHLHELAKQGHQATLVVPRRFGTLDVDPAEFFGKAINFSVVRIVTIDLLWLPFLKRFWHWLGVATFGFFVLAYVRTVAKTEAVVITNDLLIAWLLPRFGYQVVYEVHDYPGDRNRMFINALKSVASIMTNNLQKAEHIKVQYPNIKDKVFGLHNAVDIERFQTGLCQTDARRLLSLDPEKKYIMYTGHLYGWKGAAVLAEAADQLTKDCVVLFVGGTEQDIATFKNRFGKIPNLVFACHQPPALMPTYLASADVLVLPNSATSEQSIWQTSPMKLFEYMASGRPIVASDLPSICEVLTDTNALLVTPDSPASIANAIKALLNDRTKAVALAAQAMHDVEQYTWEKRACAMLDQL